TKRRNGDVIAVKSVASTDYLMLVASDGKLIQMPIKDIRTIGRSTSGVTLMRLDKDKGVTITSIAILTEEKNGGNE
ncbi:MAG: DNA gyrase C-terminal beta-propeller domain-containing protein, partial [Promethearchaeota archaeon]